MKRFKLTILLDRKIIFRGTYLFSEEKEKSYLERIIIEPHYSNSESFMLKIHKKVSKILKTKKHPLLSIEEYVKKYPNFVIEAYIERQAYKSNLFGELDRMGRIGYFLGDRLESLSEADDISFTPQMGFVAKSFFVE